ncbi:MAG: DUF1805 domain-containing protein [Lentisphaeria bacterium]|nr:DUF1805 domain-containing protein [Lentisphaeria bacterium]MBQ8753749.1 DUF1805 domain-containing protein [Lentisphaeria bacterium]MBQ9775143.1 DUF1805 domain-containing protein [Lentisphaeria bacterium]
MWEEFAVDGVPFKGIRIPTEHGTILLIQGSRSNLGCGYFSMAPADFLGDRFAVVTGVKNFDDMLNAKVVALSSAAIACGAEPGMTGKEVLLIMEK